MIDGGEVFDAFDWFEIEEDTGERVDIGYSSLLGLAHEDFEDETEVVLLDVVEVESVEADLLFAEDALHLFRISDGVRKIEQFWGFW